MLTPREDVLPSEVRAREARAVADAVGAVATALARACDEAAGRALETNELPRGVADRLAAWSARGCPVDPDADGVAQDADAAALASYWGELMAATPRSGRARRAKGARVLDHEAAQYDTEVRLIRAARHAAALGTVAPTLAGAALAGREACAAWWELRRPAGRPVRVGPSGWGARDAMCAAHDAAELEAFAFVLAGWAAAGGMPL